MTVSSLLENEAQNHSIISKFDNRCGSVRGHAVMCVERVEQGTQDTTLRAPTFRVMEFEVNWPIILRWTGLLYCPIIYCVSLSAKGKQRYELIYHLKFRWAHIIACSQSRRTLFWADYLSGFTSRGQSLSHKYIHFRSCVWRSNTMIFIRNPTNIEVHKYHDPVYKPSCGIDNILFRDYKWIFINSLFIWKELLGFPLI